MPRLWPGMLEAYSVLARFYDLCMEVDYGEWVSYLLALCRLHGHDPGSIIDLGCGTGNLTLPLAEAGYSLVGVDQSRAMIAEAQGKAAERRLEIPFYVADLREFSLPGRAFEIALSCCDVLNYLTEEDSLRKAFARVHQLLAPGGCGCLISTLLGNCRRFTAATPTRISMMILPSFGTTLSTRQPGSVQWI